MMDFIHRIFEGNIAMPKIEDDDLTQAAIMYRRGDSMPIDRTHWTLQDALRDLHRLPERERVPVLLKIADKPAFDYEDCRPLLAP
jgi:hypothetical protein